MASVTRQALTEYLETIEQLETADTLVIYGPIFLGFDQRVRMALEAIDYRRGCVLVVLDTPGGLIEPVRRIVATIRHLYKEARFLIHDRAMSVGTVLALSGDAILMDYFACLGPIDPQLQVMGPDGPRLVPALAYLSQFERLRQRSTGVELSHADIILLHRLDLAELERFELEKRRSVDLVTEWLTQYKFKDWVETETTRIPVTDEIRRLRARQIGQQLADHKRWGSHGHGISMETLRDELKLKIDDYGERDGLRGAVARYFHLLADTKKQNIVHTRSFYE